MSNRTDHNDIRIGTMAGKGAATAGYISKILPHGFETFEINFWQTLGGCDLKKLAREVAAVLDGTGAKVSCLGVFGNPMDPSSEDFESTTNAWKECIDKAHLFGTDLVCGFTGRMIGKSIPDNMGDFKKVWSKLAKRAADKGVRIGFENCSMGGDWNSGGFNIAHNPAAWEMMFNEVCADNIGLEWEPCHQLVQLIEPLPQLRKWAKKIFHLHGKDATIKRDVIGEYGIQGAKAWAYHRTPGFGDTDWTAVISELREQGWRGSIDIEGWHDPVYRADLEMTGQVYALNYLKQCRGGAFVPPAE